MCYKQRLIIILLTMAFAACQEEIRNELPEQETAGNTAPDIIAVQDNSDAPSRTVLEVDGEGVGTIYWNPADEINVFYGTTSTHYVSQNVAEATTAIFSTTDIIGSNESASEDIWGLYPYNSSATCDGSSVTTTLPAIQHGVPGTFDDDLFITLAHNSSKELSFFNVCGGIKFSLSRNDITSITFKGNNNESIAGDVSVSYVNNVPMATVTGGEKVITVKPKTGTAFVSGEDYYIVMIPCSLDGGFTMTFSTTGIEEGTFTYTDKAVSIQRSVFGKKANIDTFATFDISRNIIKYTSSNGSIQRPRSEGTDMFGANIISNVYENGEGIITFDAPVTKIGSGAFGGNLCSDMSTITIPNTVTEIGALAFAIENLSAFYGKFASPDHRCLINNGKVVAFAPNGLTEYNLPSGTVSIGVHGMFSNKLTKLILPDGFTTIENRGTFYCYELEKLVFPESMEYIGDNVLRGLSVALPAGVTYIGATTVSAILELNSITPPEIGANFISSNHNTLIYVPQGTGDSYKSLLPAYASRIREKGNQPLNEIWYTTTDNGPAISNRSNHNIVPSWEQTIVSNTDGRIVFDAPLTKIPYDAFENSNMITVSVPDGADIGQNAFQLSTSLREVDISRCGRMKIIEHACFNGCTALTEIHMPSEITEISSYAFYGCTSLSSISIPPTVTTIRNSFMNCTGLASVDIPEGVTILGGSFLGCRNLKTINLPSSLSTIERSTFYGCSSLMSVTLPERLTEIEPTVFFGCASLSSIVIPKNVTKIGYEAFSGCSSLSSVTVKASTPPSGSDMMFYNTNNCPILVYGGAVDEYKTARYWSGYSSRIVGGDDPSWMVGQIPIPGYAVKAMAFISVVAGQTVTVNIDMWDGGVGCVCWETGGTPIEIMSWDEGYGDKDVSHTYSSSYSGYIYALTYFWGSYSAADGMGIRNIRY